MKCYILDDIYWKSIYLWLKELLPEINYPVQENIFYPLDYIPLLKSDDIVLLDNFFRSRGWWEEPLWDLFLEEILKMENPPAIIWISDYGKVLIEKFDNRWFAHVKGIITDWVSTKDPKDMVWPIKKALHR